MASSIALTLVSLLCLLTLGSASNLRRVPTATTTTPFAIATPCTQTAVSIPNGDFETTSFSPWRLNLDGGEGSSIVHVSPGYSGSAGAAQMTSGDSSAILQQRLPICPATKYSFSLAYQALNANTNCSLTMTISLAETHFHQKQLTLTPGTGWAVASIDFNDAIRGYAFVQVALVCVDGTTAVALVDDVHLTPTGTLEPSGCPHRAPAFNNGDFETGQLAPWVPVNNPNDNVPYTIASPGYNSNYALSIDFPTANSSSFEVGQVIDQPCVDALYKFSFAINWNDYSFNGTSQYDGCWIDVQPLQCAPPGENSNIFHHYAATAAPGWNLFEFECTSTNNVGLSYLINADCYTLDPGAEIPAFSLLLDSFTVQNVT